MTMRPRITLRSIAIALALGAVFVAAAPDAAHAQKSKCGSAAELADDLEFVVDYFTDSLNTPLLAEFGVASLTESDPRAVVTDPRLCNQLLGATRTALRKAFGGKDNPFGSYTFAFFRVGQYYVSMQFPEEPAGLVVSARVELLVFRVSDMSLIARLRA